MYEEAGYVIFNSKMLPSVNFGKLNVYGILCMKDPVL